MAAKNIDFKQLLLDKGEKIGMGAALAVMLLLIVIGSVSAIGSDNPAVIAADIRKQATTIENKLASGPPTSPREINPKLMDKLDKETVALTPYLNGVDNFVPLALEDNKHKAPAILMPVEAVTQVVRAPVKVLLVSPQNDKLRVGVLKPKEKPKEDNSNPQAQEIQKFLESRKGNPAQLRRAVIHLRHVPGLVEAYIRMLKSDSGEDKYDLELVDVTKVDKDMRLATTVQPQRMVIVTAAFPYLAQLNAYRVALKEHSVEKLAASKDMMPQFLPFNVQRRAVDANGKVREPWAPLDLGGNYAAAFQYQFGPEPEDPALKDVIFRGLVMSRPQLARGEYGHPRLSKIDEALNGLLKNRGTNTIVAIPAERLKGSGFDPFGQVAPAEDDKGAKSEPKTGDPEQPKSGEKLLVPEFCLVRFIDADEKLKPGLTYEYRLQIKVANPNYGKPKEVLAYPSLAEDKELTSPWWPKEGGKEVIQAQMTPEFYYYGTELDDRTEEAKRNRDTRPSPDPKDVAFLQAHRWLERVRLNPESAATLLPVGDWSVCDILVRRGEYIARTEPVELPIWFPVREAFGLATPAAPTKKINTLVRRPKASPGIPVNFVPKGAPDLLVDFEGGKIRQVFQPTEKGRTTIPVREDAAVEYLILRADGSLIVRNSRADAKDPVREKAHAQWKKQLGETGEKKSGSGGKGDPKF